MLPLNELARACGAVYYNNRSAQYDTTMHYTSQLSQSVKDVQNLTPILLAFAAFVCNCVLCIRLNTLVNSRPSMQPPKVFRLSSAVDAVSI